MNKVKTRTDNMKSISFWHALLDLKNEIERSRKRFRASNLLEKIVNYQSNELYRQGKRLYPKPGLC